MQVSVIACLSIYRDVAGRWEMDYSWGGWYQELGCPGVRAANLGIPQQSGDWWGGICCLCICLFFVFISPVAVLCVFVVCC